jgi:hypothetical protein
MEYASLQMVSGPRKIISSINPKDRRLHLAPHSRQHPPKDLHIGGYNLDLHAICVPLHAKRKLHHM